MKRDLICTILIFLLLLNFKTSGQVQELNFRKVEKELIRNAEVFSIYTSPITKFTWFSTSKGFFRFDGNDFLLSKEWHQVNLWDWVFTEDSKGSFYLWDPNSGLFYLNTKTNKTEAIKFAKDSLFSSSGSGVSITSLFAEDDETLWAGTGRSSLLEISLPDKKIKEYKAPSELIKKYLPPYNENVAGLPLMISLKDQYQQNYFWLGLKGCFLLFDKGKKAYINSYPACTKYNSFSRVLKMENYGKDSLIFSTAGDGLGFFDKRTNISTCYPYNEMYAEKRITRKNSITSFYIKGSKIYSTFRDTTPAIFDINNKSYSFFTGEDFKLLSYLYNDPKNAVWGINNYKPVYSKRNDRVFRKIDISRQKLPNAVPNFISRILWDDLSQKLYGGMNGGDGVISFSGNLSGETIYGFDMSGQDKFLQEREVPVLNLVKAGTDILATSADQLIFLKKENETLFKPEKLFTSYGSFSRALALNYSTGSGLYVLDTLYNLILFKNYPDTGRIITNFSNYAKRPAKPFNGKIICIGDIIYSSDTYNIYCYNKKTNKIATLFKSSDDKKNEQKQAFDFIIDSHENIWILNSRRGLEVFSPGFTEITDKYLTTDLAFTSLTTTDSGQVLGATEGDGLVIFDVATGSKRQITTQNGLANDRIWGVFCFNGKILLSYPDFVEYTELATLLIKKTPPITYVPFIKTLKNDSVIISPDNYLLRHNDNFISIQVSSLEYDNPEQVIYQYRLKGFDTNWINGNYFNRNITFSNLKPRSYSFEVRAKFPDSDWSDIRTYPIVIRPAFWQTTWFKIACLLIAGALIVYIYKTRIRLIKNREQQIAKHEKELLELEAKALRAQMNPHFIFNCMNSIKSLMQAKEIDKGVTYLTTFSKLIRTLFNNADKKQISLYDEIETCKLYLQLEAMRFDSAFSYSVNVDEQADLKSIHVPALIVQPFIENAIWHGIVPKGGGGNVSLSVLKNNGGVEIIIDDDGIGREASQQNKAASNIGHNSKGVNLTQSRLELDNLLQQRQAVLKTIDKKDDAGKNAGTKVIIKLSQEE